MVSWFARLMRAGPASNDLARRLSHYPPYRAPHVGPPRRWTPEQAHENLQHLLAHLDERLAAVGALLREDGIDTAPALAGGDALALVDQIHAWAGAHWPALLRKEQATLAHWLGTTRDGDDIAFSMLLDVSLLFGELIRRRDPRWIWALDEDPVNRRDGMVSAMRPVLLLRSTRPDVPDIDLDLEDLVVGRYAHPDDSGIVLNPWRRTVNEAITGALDPWV